MYPIKVNDHSRDGRVGAVQSYAHTAYAVYVHRGALLFGVRNRIGQHNYQAVGIAGNLN